MSAKLRSVRVLVVNSEGLKSLYSPEKTEAQAETILSDKDVFPTTTSAAMAYSQTESKDGNVITSSSQSNNSGSPVNESNDHNQDHDLETNQNNPVDSIIVTTTKSSTTPTEPLLTQSVAGGASGGSENVMFTPHIYNDLHVEGPFSFELKVVSLIHQKSLVIAELKWDEIGANPTREYLITWELTGGGLLNLFYHYFYDKNQEIYVNHLYFYLGALKGHMLTDSTSVTLSLWPDTTYQIQVSQKTKQQKNAISAILAQLSSDYYIVPKDRYRYTVFQYRPNLIYH